VSSIFSFSLWQYASIEFFGFISISLHVCDHRTLEQQEKNINEIFSCLCIPITLEQQEKLIISNQTVPERADGGVVEDGVGESRRWCSGEWCRREPTAVQMGWRFTCWLFLAFSSCDKNPVFYDFLLKQGSAMWRFFAPAFPATKAPKCLPYDMRGHLDERLRCLCFYFVKMKKH